jgi:hypothetical protein
VRHHRCRHGRTHRSGHRPAGGLQSKQTIHKQAPKAEPRPHSINPKAVVQIGISEFLGREALRDGKGWPDHALVSINFSMGWRDAEPTYKQGAQCFGARLRARSSPPRHDRSRLKSPWRHPRRTSSVIRCRTFGGSAHVDQIELSIAARQFHALTIVGARFFPVGEWPSNRNNGLRIFAVGPCSDDGVPLHRQSLGRDETLNQAAPSLSA